ncbi:LytR C-terminal domain-containing protein [Bifidobacterium sp. ESL0682]|uniref:LytR C-terminal domain-containing protein n=1 Tax=Bifidobacterium sp. ESL0682 TaxID=2983212 RepID=UPI0023F9E878|nr:LytR C-terminal domain-containing protein [Bifidobacterium sp. ESL0682]WEV41434.1 LytR C-terminal domain-containing protein [Bifidobacterium sp. ESL0682]
MARDEQDTYESYPKDAFDNPPKGPVGVHRGNTSLISRFIPYLIVVIVAVLAGLLVWGLYSGELQKTFSGHGSDSSQSVSASKTEKKKTTEKKDTAKKDAAKSDTSSESEQQQQATSQPEQQVNKQTAVQVVNATRINGYAAKKQNVLQQSGYSSVTAANPSGKVPSASVVWYQNEDEKATAQDVANTLGITSVQQQSGISQPIVAVLLN